MFEQGDQVDELVSIICRSSSDFDHRLSSACSTSPTKPPTRVPLMRIY
jgi:hypothetical protein